MQAYKICRDLFQQFIITCSETVPDTTELRTRDVLDSSFDFHQRFPCHAYALELEHPNKLRLSDSLFFTNTADIPANVNAGLFDFLLHAIKLLVWTRMSPIFLYLIGME